MTPHALAAAFVLATWWASTGVVLRAVWRGRSTHRASVGMASVVAALSIAGLVWSSSRETPTAAYAGFASAIGIWAWHELTFLLGWVTGPRKLPCPPEARGARRFVLATATLLHHELALAGTAIAVTALTWRAPNQVGTSTFLVLWVMRLSAKLNVFLGVQSLTEEFVPAHLRYLLSYFRRARLNPLMPVSLAAGALVTFRLAREAVAADASSFVFVARTLVATILALAVVEHLFLAIPLKEALLWRWALGAKEARRDDRVQVLHGGAP